MRQLLLCSLLCLGFMPDVARAQQCSLERFSVFHPVLRPRVELSAHVTFSCEVGQSPPQVTYVRREGRRTEVHLDSLVLRPAAGTTFPSSWILKERIGPLPMGINTVALMGPGDHGPEQINSVEWEVRRPDCGTHGPAATLLFPYIEVDLDQPSGLTTLVSINNISPLPTLARAVLWSDWNLPLLAFDLYLEGHDILTLNLRDVLQGQLPQSGHGLDQRVFPGCSAPLALPALDDEAIQALQTKMAGRPDPESGLCLASNRGEGANLVGFLTVDALNRCSDQVLYPTQDGYFEPGGDGVASDINTLWGDFFLLDPSNNSASGYEAVGVTAQAPETPDARNFYPTPFSNRQALPFIHQSRYLNGGSFAGGGELLLWLGHFAWQQEGYACGTDAVTADIRPFVGLRATGEDGTLPDNSVPLELDAFVQRRSFDEAQLQLPANAGVLELRSNFSRYVPILPDIENLQSVVLTRLRAGQRFSVGFQSTTIGRGCP